MYDITEIIEKLKDDSGTRRFIPIVVDKKTKELTLLNTLLNNYNMIQYINKHSDSKTQAIQITGVKFQDFFFRPSVGLNYWIRWGRYCIDLRPICQYLKIKPFFLIARTQEDFEKEIEHFIKKLPCDPFLFTVQDAIHAHKDKKKVQNKTPKQEDSFPF